MKNSFFEQFKEDLKIDNDEQYEKICDVVWKIYEENGKEFINICERIIKIFTRKAHPLYENDKYIGVSENKIPHDSLYEILEVTEWGNIIKTENHNLEIIDFDKILPYDRINDIVDGPFIFRDFCLFVKVYQAFGNKLEMFK